MSKTENDPEKEQQLDSDGRPMKEFGHEFFQAQMSHMYAQVSPQVVILCLFVVAVVFIPVGAATIIASDAVFEHDSTYSKIHSCTVTSNQGAESYTVGNSTISMGCTTNVVFKLEKSLVAPAYIYYRIKGFNQNFRLYAQSFDEEQLTSGSSDVTDNCDPRKNAGATITVAGAEKKAADFPYAPCGQVPWSMFNDTISLFRAPDEATAQSITPSGALPASVTSVCAGGAFDRETNDPTSSTSCEKRGIAFSQDVNSRFKADIAADSQWTGKGFAGTSDNEYFRQGYYNGEPGHRIPEIRDEDFMVWSRIAPLNDFKKLYRKVTADLAAGWYVWRINERFDTTTIGAEKHVVIATTSWVGAKNHVLGALYLTMGSISLALAFGACGMYIARRE